MKPQAAIILRTLQDGREHSAIEWKRGQHEGVHVDAVSQRIGELRRLGYRIEGGRSGQAVASYRLIADSVPSVHDHEGALFPTCTVPTGSAGSPRQRAGVLPLSPASWSGCATRIGGVA